MIMTKKEEGSIGIDINVDHIAVAHIDRQGNLCRQQILPMKLKGKKRNFLVFKQPCALSLTVR